jgi:hypothetical protein
VPVLSVQSSEERADWERGEEIRAEIKARRETEAAGSQ